MKRFTILIAYSILVTVLLLLAGYRGKENIASINKTDYSALRSMEQAKDVPLPQLAPQHKEITFKDKSLAKGVDAAPSVSFG